MSETSLHIKIGVSNDKLEDILCQIRNNKIANISACDIEDMKKIIIIDEVRNNGVKYH